MTLRSLRVPAVVLVGAIWTLAFIEGLFTQSFTALAITTPVVMLAAGAVFAIRNGWHGNGGSEWRDGGS